MARRNPNGYGGVTKLSGNRKRPYMAYVSRMEADGDVILPRTKKSIQNKIEALQTIDDPADLVVAAALLRYEVDELLAEDDITAEDYCRSVIDELADYIKRREFRANQRKVPIGYYETATEANIALAEYNKSPYDLDGRKITFKKVYDLAYKDAKISKKSDSTKEIYASSFKRCAALHDMAMADIKLIHLQEPIREASGMSKATQGGIKMVEKLVFAYAVKNDIVEKDYSRYVAFDDVKPTEKKTPLTREEVHFLWEKKDWIYEGKSDRNLTSGTKVVDALLILVYTGMRIEELLSLESSLIHIKNRYIDLQGTKTRAARRLIPIHAKILPLLENRLNEGRKHLITDRFGDRISYSNFVASPFAAFCEQFDFAHTLHECRHTFATFTASKLDPVLRAYIIGHATGEITNDTYTHPEVLLPELIAEIDKLEI